MNIMVLDDERYIYDEVELILSADEYTISGEYASTQKASQAIQNNPPDIMFIDALLPGRSGIDFSKWLKEVYPNIKIILMSEDPIYAVKAMEMGIEGFLLKPLTTKKTLETIYRITHV